MQVFTHYTQSRSCFRLVLEGDYALCYTNSDNCRLPGFSGIDDSPDLTTRAINKSLRGDLVVLSVQ